MTDRDRLAADLLTVMRESHGPNGPNDLRGDDPHEWMADRLIALGWTRLDEERLARALVEVEEQKINAHPECLTDECNHQNGCPDWGCLGCGDAAAIAKAYREDA